MIQVSAGLYEAINEVVYADLVVHFLFQHFKKESCKIFLRALFLVCVVLFSFETRLQFAFHN